MYKRNNKAHGQKVGGCLSLLGLPQQTLQTGWLKQEKSIVHSSGGWKSQVRVPAQSDSGEFSFPALQMATLLLCPHLVERKTLSSYESMNPIMRAPPA